MDTPPEAGHPVPVDSKHCPQLKKLLSAGLEVVCGVKGRGDPVNTGRGSFLQAVSRSGKFPLSSASQILVSHFLIQ